MIRTGSLPVVVRCQGVARVADTSRPERSPGAAPSDYRLPPARTLGSCGLRAIRAYSSPDQGTGLLYDTAVLVLAQSGIPMSISLH